MSVPSLDTLTAALGTTPFNWLVPGSVLVASLVGSVHCVSMCGPLVLAVASNRKRQVAYQAGRMISYVALGTVAGAFGEGVLGKVRVPWLSELSLIFIALTLIIMGYRTLTGRGMHMRLPAPLERGLQKLWMRLRLARLAPWASAGLTGLLTVFLPCGHLYGFAAGAMATGRWWAGALYMFAFWIGTLPALGFGAAWLRSLLNSGLKSAPRWAGVLLIVAGLFGVVTFAARLNALNEAGSGATHESHGMHEDSHPKAFRCH